MNPADWSIMPRNPQGDRALVESAFPQMSEAEREYREKIADDEKVADRIAREREEEEKEGDDNEDWKPRHRTFLDLSGNCEAGPDNT